ncbi:hypothetical protein ACFWNF_16290 [Streptomyces anulatus]|uniref:hypothetical protein n=1 Tax=Streptomyces anulatus TaxID=1892 RepID=UPI003660A789
MSSRNRRTAAATEMLPYMPDVVDALPPKAGEGEWVGLTLEEAIARTLQIVDEAHATYPEAAGMYWLSSGGKDSAIVGHVLRGRYAGVLHVNTGTGIPETTEYVRDVAAAWGDVLHELHPKNRYADLVLGRVIAGSGPNAGIRPIWKGFPGPDGHKVMYRQLKHEPLTRFRRELLGDQSRLARKERKRVIYLGGMRWAESQRRFRNAEAIDPAGSIVWVSPLVHWTDAHMREYRNLHRCQQDHEHATHRLCFDGALPLNEVTEHIHMSGECLCGAYAKPGELDEIEFFYPEVAARLKALEAEAEQAGVKYCRWGQKNGGVAAASAAGRLCSSCVEYDPNAPRQGGLEDDWLAAGLITADQRDNLRANHLEEAS